MELGQLLKQARLDAGLSQRQLCGERITRNMLSQIENGSARPSMETLLFLAERLGKPVSYFLEETAASVNQERILQARAAWSNGNPSAALKAIDGIVSDDIFGAEERLLQALCYLALAQTSIADGRLPYAGSLLEKAASAGKNTPYYTEELERKRLLLLAKASASQRSQILQNLPDDELLLRAAAAYENGELHRCAALLDAAADHTTPGWNLLRGDVYFAQEDYANAQKCFLQAENQALRRLEICCEKLGDYKMAYHYACKQR